METPVTILTLCNQTLEFTGKDVYDVIKMFAAWEPSVIKESGPFVQYSVPSTGIHNAPSTCRGAIISIHPRGINLGVTTLFDYDIPIPIRKYKRVYEIPHYLHRQFEYVTISTMKTNRNSIRLEKNTRYSEIALVSSEFIATFVAWGYSCKIICVEKQLCPLRCITSGIISFPSSPVYQVQLWIDGQVTDKIALDILHMCTPRSVRGNMKLQES
jgi:hypothetical protein